MSDTPRTDAAVQAYYESGQSFAVVEPELSRQLERELNEANKELHQKYIEFDALFNEAEQIRIERDAALAENTAMREAIREVFYSFADDPPSDASWLLDDRQNHALARLYPFTTP
jgi:hypothetical protein